MKKSLALMAMLIAFAATPVMAMNVDDILELCRAGFEPDRIARIVEATGIEQPLEAADWSRIRTEACGDDVVDALLHVLAPVEEVTDNTANDSGQDNVNVNLYADWGTNGWYGSGFWGGRSSWWGIGYSTYDPWWSWSRRWAYSSWYDPWWSYRYGGSYYCHSWNNPYYYSGGHYTGGYYSGGIYQRQKALRLGETTKAYRYASAKASPVMTKAKPYRGGVNATGMNANGGVAVRKSSRTSVTTDKGTTYARAKSSTVVRGSSGVSTGSVKQRSTTSTAARTNGGYSKRKAAVNNGGASSTGNSTTVNRSKSNTRMSSRTSGASSTVKRKSSGATSTGKAPSMRAPRTGSRSSGPSYRAPSGGRSTGQSFRAPSGGGGRSSAPRMGSGSGRSGGGGRSRP